MHLIDIDGMDVVSEEKYCYMYGEDEFVVALPRLAEVGPIVWRTQHHIMNHNRISHTIISQRARFSGSESYFLRCQGNWDCLEGKREKEG